MARLNMEEVKALENITISGQKPEFCEIIDLIQTIKHLQQKNEQLKAQVARIPDICKWWDGWSCTAYQSDEMKCPHCCPNWEGDNKYAVYHNPADVEALRKAREALIDYKTFLESFQCTCEPSNETYPGVCCERCCRLNQAKQALAEIDKVLGGEQ